MAKIDEFYDKVMQDESLKARISEIINEAEGDEVFDKVDEMAKDMGFDISAEELKSSFELEELPDEELDNVSGGIKLKKKFDERYGRASLPNFMAL